jgi:N-acetylneuraminate synthase
MSSTFLIAEAGVNHNGDLEHALALVDVALASGANAIKFQSFITDEIVSTKTPQLDYQREGFQKESQREMLEKLELTPDEHRVISDYCGSKNIEFMSTPFDPISLAMLVDLGIKRVKIPSGEITNSPLLLAAAKTGLPVILSTGMSTLSDIESALGVLAFGYCGSNLPPSAERFNEAYFSHEGRKKLKDKVILLHCVSSYPCADDRANLRAIETMRNAFGLSVGYSDHTIGLEAAFAATAMGATVIEKHLTLNKEWEGPDHKTSLNPEEFKALASGIRKIESCLGDGVKVPLDVELQGRGITRRGVYANTDIELGEIFSVKHLKVQRPVDGVSPMNLFDLIGKPSTRSYKKDEPVWG